MQQDFIKLFQYKVFSVLKKNFILKELYNATSSFSITFFFSIKKLYTERAL
jgi:hypothetical protein